MDSILDYFISLQESEPAELPERAIERWNKRADFWEDARKKKEKGDERVISAINYLDSKGLLERNYDVADIGCGPGRFAAAFAKYVHKVVGLDISDKMVKHGMEHIQNEGLNNAILYTCNFQTLDIDKSGYTHAFDLVFSSMTPAIHNMDGLIKSMEMSRAWCCNITHLDDEIHSGNRSYRKYLANKQHPNGMGDGFSLFSIYYFCLDIILKQAMKNSIVKPG